MCALQSWRVQSSSTVTSNRFADDALACTMDTCVLDPSKPAGYRCVNTPDPSVLPHTSSMVLAASKL